MYCVKFKEGFWIGPGKPFHPLLGMTMTHCMAIRIAEMFGGKVLPA